MLVENLLSLISSFINGLFSLLPDIPSMPSAVTTPIESIIDLIFDNAGIIGIFVSIDLIKVLVPLIIIVINFDEIYRVIVWIVKKIPILNIE